LIFRFSDFEIDIARHELRHAGAIVHIEPQVFDLLVHLVRNRDRIVSKDELIDAVWQGRIVSEATLSSRISAARRALGDSGNDQSFIRTLYKRGFRFVGDVDEGAAPVAIATEAGPPAAAAAHHAAQLVPHGEPLPLRDNSLITGLSLETLGRHPEREFAADSLAVAAALPPALSELASGDAAGEAVSPSGHGADPAPRETPAENATAPTGSLTRSWATRNLLLALAMVAFGRHVVVVAAVVARPVPHSIHERSRRADEHGRSGARPDQGSHAVDRRSPVRQSQR